MDQWLTGKAKEIRNLRLMKGKNPALLLLKGLLPEVSLGKGRNQSCEYQWACRWLAFSSMSSSSFLYSLKSLGEVERYWLCFHLPESEWLPVARTSGLVVGLVSRICWQGWPAAVICPLCPVGLPERQEEAF